MNNGNFPTLTDFRNHLVNQLGVIEVLRQSLYDTIVYPTAGLAALLFFQVPQGQGFSASPGNAGNVKVLTDTNMVNGGSLPSPQGFWSQSAEVDVQPGSSAATVNTFALQIPKAVGAAAATLQAGSHDVNAIYSAGSLEFTIGMKPYLQEAPLLKFPPKARFEYDVAIGADSNAAEAMVAEKLRAGGRPYKFSPGFSIMTSQNFQVALRWPVIVPTPSTNNAAIRVILDGWLFRAVQ